LRAALAQHGLEHLDLFAVVSHNHVPDVDHARIAAVRGVKPF
jgi:hypothetical protein